MGELIRTDSQNKLFIKLVRQLDKELAVRDGDDHAFYHQFNGIDQLKYIVLAMNNGEAVACGAIKRLTSNTVEVKRMFTLIHSRRKGMAGLILSELERWAFELGYRSCVLETGVKQPEAIKLYQRKGYIQIDNYGQYKGVANSLCFEKQLLL